MGWASLIGKGIGLAVKHGPKAAKTFGQISEGSKKFGTIIDGSRKFGTIINNASGGKIGNSKFGRDVTALTDKAEQITAKVGSASSQAQGGVQQATEKLQRM